MEINGSGPRVISPAIKYRAIVKSGRIAIKSDTVIVVRAVRVGISPAAIDVSSLNINPPSAPQISAFREASTAAISNNPAASRTPGHESASTPVIAVDRHRISMAVACINTANLTALVLQYVMVANLRFMANRLMSCFMHVLRGVSGPHIFA